MEKRRIRTGVVGVGRMGRHHARIYATHPSSQFIGVFDIHREKCQAIADEYHAKAFPTLEALLSEVDAITIAVPTSLHSTVCRTTFERGIHALIEKPIASTLEEARDIVSTAQKNKTISQIGHVERFNSAFQKLVELTKDRIPLTVDAVRKGPPIPRANDVSVVLDLMIHDIDIIFSIIKGNIERFSAIGRAIHTPTLDYATAQLQFTHGPVINLIASKITPQRERRLTANYGNFCYEVNFIDSTLRKWSIDPDSDAGRPETHEEAIPLKPVEPLYMEADMFLDSILNNRPSPLSAEFGLKVLETALSIEFLALKQQI